MSEPSLIAIQAQHNYACVFIFSNQSAMITNECMYICNETLWISECFARWLCQRSSRAGAGVRWAQKAMENKTSNANKKENEVINQLSTLYSNTLWFNRSLVYIFIPEYYSLFFYALCFMKWLCCFSQYNHKFCFY